MGLFKKTVSIFCFWSLFLVSISAADTKDTTVRVWLGKLNINTASEADFAMLSGIGNITAHRIVKLREDSSGFKSIAEIKRVKGINEDLFQKIEPNLTLSDKSDLKVVIDINSATIEALKRLPGISEKEASSIIEYRDRSEGFEKVEDIPFAGIDLEQYDEIKDLITLLPYEPLKKKQR